MGPEYEKDSESIKTVSEQTIASTDLSKSIEGNELSLSESYQTSVIYENTVASHSEKFIEDKIAPILIQKRSKIIIVMIYIGLIAVSVLGVMNMKVYFS